MTDSHEQPEQFIEAADLHNPSNQALGSFAVEVETQFRSEHSRSVDDAEKYQALFELQRLGALIPLS